MEKGLLLDRIALHSSDVSPRNVELSAAVKADFADSNLSISDGAAMPTSEAADPIPFNFLV